MGALVPLTAVLIGLLVAHDLDHLLGGGRTAGGELSAGAYVLIATGFAATFGSLFLSLRRDRRAPLAAAVVGLGWAGGFAWVHLIGAGSFWGPFGVPYTEADVSAVTWVLGVLPMVAALALAVAGVRAAAPVAGARRTRPQT